MRRFALAAIPGLVAGLLLVGAARASTTELRIAVLLVNWPDDTSQPITTTRVVNEMFVNSGSVAAFYADTSYGQVHVSGDVLGWYTVGSLKSAGCTASAWANDAETQAVASGLDPAGYDVRVFMWRSAGCGWTGYTNGDDVYVNYLQTGIHEPTIAHELGHVIGFGHAGAYICNRDGVQISLPVSRGDSCEVWDYADRYDTMGNSSFYGFNAIHRSMAGWLTDTQTVTVRGTYTLAPLEWSSGIRQLEVIPPRQGNNPPPLHLCLEVRQSYGWDQFDENGIYGNPWATRGVHVHQMASCLTDSQGSFGSGKSFIIDATPDGTPSGGSDLLDFPLPVGRTLVGAGITITTIAIGTDGATVFVDYPKGKH